MTTKEWYKWFLEKNVTMREVDQERRLKLIPCKVEERMPEVSWGESYRISRLKGLSPLNKSFLFKLIHTILPSKERLHHLNQNVSPQCMCDNGAEESYLHLFFQCELNKDAGQAMLRCVSAYDRTITEEKALRLELQADDPFLVAMVNILATGLELIWENRKLKKATSFFLMRAELEAAISIRRRSRFRALKETSKIMENLLKNFVVAV